MIKKNYKHPMLKIVYIEDINTITTSDPDIITERKKVNETDPCHIWGDGATDF